MLCNQLKKKLEPLLVDKLVQEIPIMMNTKLQAKDGYMTPLAPSSLFDKFTIDLAVVEAPRVSQQSLNFAFNGGIFGNEKQFDLSTLPT